METQKKRSLLKKTGHAILRLFTILGIIVFCSFVFMAISLRNVGTIGTPILSDNTVLTYTFENELPETQPMPSLSGPLLFPPLLLHDLISVLDTAAADPKITGFLARIKPNMLSIAQVQELRDALARFRESGKFAYVFATSYGDFSNGMKDYYLASAFGDIWLQPIGSVSITGLSGQLPFFKDTLDKVGVKADMIARAEYKTAVEPMTRSFPSKENDQMTERLLSTLNSQMVSGMAESRDLLPEYMQALIDRAPLTAEQALEVKLIDRIGYLDEMVDDAREKSGGADVAKFWEADLYYDHMNRQHEKGLRQKIEEREIEHEIDEDKKIDIAPSRVALILANGAIMPGDTNDVHMAAPIGGGPVLSAEKISAALHSARKDPRVGAIVLRIDSPGGSATASESIARAVERAQTDGKPVVISMSTAAASGGYWISAKAHKIYAQPATLTGSIGVIGGKVAIGGLLDKIGVNIAEYNYGRQAGLWSSIETFSAEERDKVNQMLDYTYDAFLSRVSEGRNIPIERLRNELAAGRVWTGAEAVKLGLVDEIGGLNNALDDARLIVDAQNPAAIEIIEYPAKKSPLEEVIDLLMHGVPMQSPVSAIWKDLSQQIKTAPAAQSAYAHLPEVW